MIPCGLCLCRISRALKSLFTRTLPCRALSATSRRPKKMNPTCIPMRRRALATILFDWAMVLALFGVFAVIENAEPYHRAILRSEMDDYKYPIVDNTISAPVLMVVCLGVPAACIVIWFLLTRNKKDLHLGLLGLCVAIVFTGILTDFVKVLIGRPRPDFYWRCFPDGVELWDGEQPVCSGSASVVREGRKSFPSGHASLSFAGLGFLAFFIAGKAHVFDRKGHVYKMVLFMAPFFLALYVALTRIRDYWHHWQDVTVGMLIGIAVAFATYRQYFPALDHAECHVAHPYRDHFSEPPRVNVISESSEDNIPNKGRADIEIV